MFVVTFNDPPVAVGNCSVHPTEGISQNTTFSVRCDSDRPFRDEDIVKYRLTRNFLGDSDETKITSSLCESYILLNAVTSYEPPTLTARIS